MTNSKNNKLDDILADLDSTTSLKKSITKTISVRLPIIDLARIDALAGMKDVSRNILLNDIIDAALTELLSKLTAKNPALAQLLESQATELADNLLNESDHPPPAHKDHKGSHKAKAKKKK